MYELTGKKFTIKEESYDPYNKTWDDGTPKSLNNAFNWKSYARGLSSQSELAAQESGRKFGMSTASKQILPRVTI